MPTSSKSVIGIVEHVSIGRRATDVPAKIDTGADSSAIWATNIRVDRKGILRFSLFGEGSQYYNGKVFKRTDFSVSKVKSSNGVSEIRYQTHFTVTIAGRRVRALFNLSDRSRNTYKILIGRRTISNKFVVDVAKGSERLPMAAETKRLKQELKESAYDFHTKYVAKKKGVAE